MSKYFRALLSLLFQISLVSLIFPVYIGSILCYVVATPEFPFLKQPEIDANI